MSGWMRMRFERKVMCPKCFQNNKGLRVNSKKACITWQEQGKIKKRCGMCGWEEEMINLKEVGVCAENVGAE